MKINTIFQAKNINDLKSLGSYYELKKHIENQLDVVLGVRGWESLFYKIIFLNKSILNNRNYLYEIYRENDLANSIKIINETLGVQIKATSLKDLENKITNLVSLLGEYDPALRFEETKIKNFKNSSKLEGIDIESPNDSTSLESIIDKYKR